jgi:hypothetical protein
MPGTDALHSALTGANIHVPHRFTYADATAREAEAGAAPGDVGCLALQQDDNTLWMLTDDDPLTWVSVGGAGGAVATDAIWDAAGDLAVGTGADTAAKLPIGTAGQHLVVNSGATAPEWATPGLVKIAEVIVAGAAADSIAFNSIPGTYRHLMIMMTGRADESAGLTAVQCQFNGDTGAHYAHQRVTGNAGSVSAAEGASAAFLYVGWLSGGTAGANYASGLTAWIYDYARSQWYKHVAYLSGHHSGLTAGLGRAIAGSGVWENTSAITAILLTLTTSGKKFDIGTVATLYGLA